MVVRPWAVVSGALPDDMAVVEEEGAYWFGEGGSPLLRIIAHWLTDLRCEVGEPKPSKHGGWVVVVEQGGVPMWLQVTEREAHYVIFEQSRRKRGAYGGWHPEYLRLLESLAARLDADPRFHDVQWYRREDGDEAQGAPTPITGSPPPADGRAPSLFSRIRNAWR